MDSSLILKNTNLSLGGLAFPRIPLINGPTAVQRLLGLGELSPSTEIYIKREDATDSIYGGNKVRNLEFLLGEAVARKANRIVTVAPLGSNFVAALAAQSKRIGISNQIYHFVPASSPQIYAHAEFSDHQGAQLKICTGGKYIGAIKATSSLLLEVARNSGSYWIAPGGSSARGTLGHIYALLELSKQIEAGEIPEPDYLFVGAGTCGTMAGLIAGVKIAGLQTKIIGVRCVDPMVCNPYRIVTLANAALGLLNLPQVITHSDVHLRDLPKLKYGEPLPDASFLIRETLLSSKIELDTTYTTKVFSFLRQTLSSGKLHNKKVLYWHTFSPAAMIRPYLSHYSKFEFPRPEAGIVQKNHAACSSYSAG